MTSRTNDMLKNIARGPIGALVWNLFIALFMLMLARVVFLAWNWDRYGEYMTSSLLGDIFAGGLRFDLATLFYINGLWMVLILLPLHWKETAVYHRIVKCIYVIFNSIALVANLTDCVYVGFTGRRTTATLFAEFSHEDNMGRIISDAILSSWPLLLLLIAGIWFMWRVYATPRYDKPLHKLRYYITLIGLLAAGALCAIASIRGGVDRTTRPITLSNANQYVNRPIEAAAVLNTPFSIIRTINKDVYSNADLIDPAVAQQVYDYLHLPQLADSVQFKQMNVVVLIVESFSRGYIGALNRQCSDPDFKGFTPHIDSLIDRSLTYRYSYANGAKSIDGMPSVLSSVPMVREPFFLTSASLNDLSSLPGYLKDKGYTSAFFHGAPNGSMGFEAFARHVGFDRYVGMTEFCESPRHNGKRDFDGTWAIWDEPFLQFFAEELTDMPEPFMAGIFTASSHHPFHVPDSLVDSYPEEGGHPLMKCIRYTDMALGRFFETASRQPWYDNTLFVLTSDHSMVPVLDDFKTDQEQYAAPVIFFAPGDTTLRGYDKERVAQQIDILPTVLNYLGYDRPYVAFGIDLFNTPADETWAFDYNNGIYQLTRGDYFMLHDGEKPKALYRFRDDPMLHDNILDTAPREQVDSMDVFLRSLVTRYCRAMKENTLTPATLGAR